MTKKIGDKSKVSQIKSTQEAHGVQRTEAISGIGSVKATSAIGGVKGAGAIGQRRMTKIMTPAERAQLFQMINEEAEKLTQDGAILPRQKEVISKAVKMAIDSGIIDDAEDDA